MVDIGKTKLAGQAVKALQEKYGKAAPGREKAEQAAAQAAESDPYLAIKAKRVEFLLAVKEESEKGFAVQAGLMLEGEDEKAAGLPSFEYDGRPISELSVEEAQALVSENGYFGVTKTAERIAEFVLNGAGDNLDKLQAGREGVQRGFQEAEKAWGGKLPDISYQTLQKALESIDARIKELGGSVIDVTA